MPGEKVRSAQSEPFGYEIDLKWGKMPQDMERSMSQSPDCESSSPPAYYKSRGLEGLLIPYKIRQTRNLEHLEGDGVWTSPEDASEATWAGYHIGLAKRPEDSVALGE